MRLAFPALVALAISPYAQAQITLDVNNSTWGGVDMVTNYGTDGSGNTLYVGQPFGPGGFPNLGAPAGAALTTTMGSAFVTIMQSTTVNTELSISPELAGSSLAAGTSVHLTYTGLTNRPSYVALIGGTVTSYSFNGGTLSITATTGALASSATNPGLSEALALVIETNPAFDFGGSVFRTNAYWGDLGNMSTLYAGVAPLAGLNVNGIAGQSVTFDAYLSLSYLASIGINSGADALAYVQKAGTSFQVPITTSLFTESGYNPQLDGVAYDIFGGQSAFDFNGQNANGGYLDDFIKATYSNSSWSAGNIGIISASAIPEPSTYGLILGGLALAGAAMRRKKISK